MNKPNYQKKQHKQVAKRLNKEQQQINQLKQQVSNLKKARGGSNRGRGKPRGRGRGRGRYNNVSNRPRTPIFSSATAAMINLQINPIHSTYAAKFTDTLSNPSHSFSDWIMYDNNIQMTYYTDLTTVAYGLVVFMSYGPGSLTFYETGTSEAQRDGWQLWGAPLDAGGLAIRNRNALGGTNRSLYPMRAANYGLIWNLAQNARMVAAGFRINSKVEAVTDNTSQFVSKFYAGQMTQADIESWAMDGGAKSGLPFPEMLKSNNMFEQYENHQGASARYNPYQAQVLQQGYYSQELLEGTDDGNTFNTHELMYPYVYMLFNNTISPSVSTSEASLKQHLQEDDNKYNDEKYSDEPSMKSDNDTIYSGDLINFADEVADITAQVQRMMAKNNNIPVVIRKMHDKRIRVSQLGAFQEINYTFPVTIEAKFWLEAVLVQPSPILSVSSPVDMQWTMAYTWMCSRANFPLWSNGHSFKSMAKWAGKNLTRKKIQRYSNYVTGVARIGRDTVGTLGALANMGN